jgi:hypothetical protein
MIRPALALPMTKKKSMYSVAQVLRPEFGRSWHEAVAIVQEVVSQLSPGLAVPAPEDLLFEDNGSLMFGFGSESDEMPVVSLGRLLQDLLNGIDAPAGLRDLATENSKSSPAHVTIEGFSRALAFYERPNRANDLSAVAARLRGARPVDTAQAEFDRLRDRVSQKAQERQEDHAPGSTDPKPQPRQLSARQRALIGAASAAVVLLIALAGFARGARDSSGAPGLLDRTEQALAKKISAGLDRMGSVAAVPAAQAKSAEAPASEFAPNPRDTRAAADAVPTPTSGRPSSRDIGLAKPGMSSSASHPPASDRNSPAPSLPSVPPLPASPQSSSPSVAPPPLALPMPTDGNNESAVYSRADPGVQPPAFLRPQMPKDPPPGVDTGYFDIVVNESGDVQQVQLVSPTRKFQERMLVAAAKAWKFRPATLNGQPVKYRLRVPIILTGMP